MTTATIIEGSKLLKVVVYSLVAGVGVSVVFGLGVSSAAAFYDALRERRMAASIAWGALGSACALATIGVIVVGIVVMAAK